MVTTSLEQRPYTREEISAQLLNDEQFIGCLSYLLHFLRMQEEYGAGNAKFITPGESAGMTAADRLLLLGDQAKLAFRSPKEVVVWLSNQLEGIAPQLGPIQSAFTAHDVSQLTTKLTEYAEEGRLGLKGYAPIKPVNKLPKQSS